MGRHRAMRNRRPFLYDVAARRQGLLERYQAGVDAACADLARTRQAVAQ